MPISDHTTCWVVTDGKSGMENQCLGLAEALALAPTVKRVKLRWPWRPLAPFLRVGLASAVSGAGDAIAPPWPQLLIATGRASVPVSLFVKRSSPDTFTVQLQNPVIDPSNFDLVVVPEHDGLTGENVMTTRGGLHRVTPAILQQAAETFAPQIAHLPAPRIVALIGGSNSVYKLTPRETAPLAGQFVHLAKITGGSLIVTPSRRTGGDNIAILQNYLRSVPSFVWDGRGDNPYYGMLGVADYILATCDSVNMVSEACTTGKPVYVIKLPGGSDKFRSFHQSMRKDGFTRPFEGRLETWTYTPLDEVRAVAERIRGMMENR